MTREEDKETKHNGIIPLIYKRIVCTLWKGHNKTKEELRDLCWNSNPSVSEIG